MDINRLPALFSSIVNQVAGNNSNATKPGKFSREIADSFVFRDSSSVGKALARRYSPEIPVGQALARRYSPEIPVGQAAPALGDVFRQAA